MKVYLAGGMQSGWQDKVVKSAPGHDYYDPRDHGLIEESQYTFWDLAAIRDSDLIFVYLERGNPSGYGLCVEVGYGKALNKSIIFIDDQQSKYFGMVRSCADVIFISLDEALKFLKKLPA